MEDREAFEALRRADPVDHERLPDHDHPRARALFQEITMATTTDTSAVTDAVPEIRTRRRGAWIAGLGAAATAAAIVVAVLVLNGGAAPAPTPAPDDLVPGGGMAMCAEIYTLETLATRSFAFDGTVVTTDGTRSTFAVNQWFHGGDAAEIELDTQSLYGINSVSMPGELAVGDRMLIAGEEDIAWTCGFSQPYDPAVAAQWEATFAG